jgi:hypothetical protein
MDTYSHVLPGLDEQAAGTVASSSSANRPVRSPPMTRR